MTPKQQRIKRLKNRIKRMADRLRICDSARGAGIARELQSIVSLCKQTDGPRNLVDSVEDYLDAKIEPRSPIAEWLTDIAIDIAAAVAVDLWNGTTARIEGRLARARAKLLRLEAAS
jgi:hypothetical protein